MNALVLVLWLTALTAAPGLSHGARPLMEGSWHGSLAVDESGRLFEWGQRLTAGSFRPLQVSLPSRAAAVFSGGSQVFVLDTGGDLWAWGNNNLGQLGDGTTVDRPLPVRIGSGYKTVSTGVNRTFAIRNDGSLWAWGGNFLGQLGIGGGFDTYTPTRIGTGFQVVAAGTYHALAVKADGTLWAWGDNAYGQLGNGTTTATLSPVQVGSGFVSVAAGQYHSLALKPDGTVWAWGLNDWGQLGTGSTVDSRTPVRVGTGFKTVVSGRYVSAAIKLDGSLWVWGEQSNGDGTSQRQTSPLQRASGCTDATVSNGATLATCGGQLLAWGDNRFGQVGNGTTTFAPAAVTIGSGYTAVAAGQTSSVALKTDGTVWTWGDDSLGQLGIGPQAGSSVPSLIRTSVKDLAMGTFQRLLLDTGGQLWAWGQGGADLGLGFVGNQPSPVLVGGGYLAIAAGSGNSFALKTDGSLWVWGGNGSSILTSNEWQPRQFGNGRYVSVAAGFWHALVLQSDGSLWTWGTNDFGQLGEGTTTDRTLPVKIGTGFSAMAGGGNHSLGLKSDGSLWAWGRNTWGQLGVAGSQNRLSPVRVGDGYSKIAAGQNHSLALKPDGTLWAWGANNVHQVGDGTGFDRFAPVRIATGIVDVFSGPTAHHSLAVRSDGTVLVWGDNTDGQLGNGTFRKTPRPVSAINATRDDVFDLMPSVGNTTNAIDLPALSVAAKKNLELKVEVTDRRANGLSGEIFFTALLPSSSPALSAAGGEAAAGAALAGKERDRRQAVGGGRRGPLSSIAVGRVNPSAAGDGAMVAGVFTRDGFKQTGGTSYVQADSVFNGVLSSSGTLSVARDAVLENSNALICMGITVPDLSAKGQVVMRPIATGTAVQGVVQCPPVQTSATIGQFGVEASGPITARTIVAHINPLAEDRGKARKLFSWAVAPDGRQYMQTGPNQWEDMTEPMRPAASIVLPTSGPYRFEVTRGMKLDQLVGTLIFIGIGESWEDVRDLNKAGHHYTVR